MKEIKFENKVSYNVDALKGMSESEFVEHEKHNFEGDPKAKEKLKEAYRLIKGKPLKETPAEE